MSEFSRVGDLEIEQDPELQRRLWMFERWGRATMAMVLLFGMLGFFGTGPFSRRSIATQDGALEVTYERFGRATSPTQIEVRMRLDATPEGIARIWLDGEYLREIQIEGIDPSPLSVEVGSKASAYLFRILEPGSPVEVNFHVKPDRSGPIGGHIRLDGHPPVEFSQFIYP